MSDSSSLQDLFQKKQVEFATDLEGAFPELAPQIQAALVLPVEERFARQGEEVFGHHMTNSEEETPGPVLPGVEIPANLWNVVSARTKKAVKEYLSLLDISVLQESGAQGLSGENPFTKEQAEKILRDWRTRLSRIDFDSITSKFAEMFGSKGENLPPLPEKFLKGKLAKMAEDMVREFKPEDFGLTKEDLEACEKDPSRAFEILMQAGATNPQVLQKAMQKVARRLQEKIQRGEFKPQELVAEAEELIQEFQNHPAFVEMMKGIREAFDFGADPDAARRSGHDGESRLSMAQARLRAKLAAKKNGGAGPEKQKR